MGEETQTVASVASTPSPVADPGAFRGKGLDAVFKALETEPDVEHPVSQEADASAAPATEATQRAEEQGQKQETELEAADWRVRVADVRKALEGVADPKLKKVLIDSFMTAKAYRQVGLRLGDIQKYLNVAPTPEILDEISQTASQYRSLMEAVASASQDGSVYALQHMVKASPQGAAALIQTISNNLEDLHPRAYRAVAEKVATNLVGNLRHTAKRENNPLLADVAHGLAVFCGFEQDAEGESEAADLPASVQKERDELRLMKQQEAERQKEEEQRRMEAFRNTVMGFQHGVLDDAYQQGADMVKGWIEENAGAYNDRVKSELWTRIGNALVKAIDANPHIQASYSNVLRSGKFDPEHHSRATQHLLAQAKTLLPHVAVAELRVMAEMFGGTVSKRQDKVAQVTGRRDVGSSGAATVEPKTSFDPKSFRGKGMDAVFAALDTVTK